MKLGQIGLRQVNDATAPFTSGFGVAVDPITQALQPLVDAAKPITDAKAQAFSDVPGAVNQTLQDNVQLEQSVDDLKKVNRMNDSFKALQCIYLFLPILQLCCRYNGIFSERGQPGDPADDVRQPAEQLDLVILVQEVVHRGALRRPNLLWQQSQD